MIERFSDYHTHAKPHGPDAESPIRVADMVQAAQDKGIIVYFADHLPLPEGFDPTRDQDCAMTPAQYVGYQKEVTEVIEANKGRRAVEADYLPGYEAWTKEQLAKYPYDAITGSVHFLGNDGEKNLLLDFDADGFKECVAYYGRTDNGEVDYQMGIEKLVTTYYGYVRDMARTGMFDIVGHIDLVKKYNEVIRDESGKPVKWTWFSEEEPWYKKAVLETLAVIEQQNMVIELNTSGWDKACQEQYPSVWILQEAKQRNIPLVLSSDAHKPDDIGKNFERAVTIAESAGYTSLVQFENRQRQEVSL